MYSTPEKAFKDVDYETILSSIKKIMDSTNKLVEADVFRKYVNRELNLSYSKYFYVALVGVNTNELSLYRANNLVDKKIIEFKSIQVICRAVCKQSFSNSENIRRIREIIWLTDSVANDAIHQWKWLLKQ